VKTKLKSAGHPAGAPPPGLSLGRAWRGLLAFYLVALALNAVSLHRNNEQMPYGPLRSFWVAVSAPAARIAAATGLDRPREFLTRTIGDSLNR
jgi:hypothetical protein